MSTSHPKVEVASLGQVEIRPTGLFAKHITTALSALMVATSQEPLDEVVADIADANPAMDDDKVMELAVQKRANQMLNRGNEEVARVMGEENLMYQLAADAIHQDLDWCVDNLAPRTASGIVKTAMDAGGLREYLGECLTLLYTATPQMEEQTLSGTDEPSPDESLARPADSGASAPESSTGPTATES